jgi:hypothetical protein
MPAVLTAKAITRQAHITARLITQAARAATTTQAPATTLKNTKVFTEKNKRVSRSPLFLAY